MNCKILIADDEEIERRALRMILENEAGLEFIEATNGIDALEMIERCLPDIAILDIRMPGLDGIALTEELRKRHPDLAVIFLTAFDQFDYARSAVRLRVLDFLLKPASATEILDTVRRARAGIAGREAPGPAGAEARQRLDEIIQLMAERLRQDLSVGLPNPEHIRKYLELRGLSGDLQAMVEIRAVHAATKLHHIPLLAESSLARGDRMVLAAANGQTVLAMAIGPDKLDPAGFQAELEALRAQIRQQLGSILVIGAACAIQNPLRPLALASAAHRAATLASQNAPSLVLTIGPEPEKTGPLEKTALADSLPARSVLVALDIMEKRHAEDLSLNGISELVGVSPSHLSRQLARCTGKGFADCLAQFRIASAKTHLQFSGVSVKEVAHLVGFHDPAYFARVFRRLEGCSPAEYRGRVLPEGAKR